MDSRLHIRMNPQCWVLKDIRSNKIYNNGIEAQDLLQEISRYFQPKDVSTKMALTRFHQTTNLGCSWTFAPWHSVCLVNTKDSVFLEIH